MEQQSEVQYEDVKAFMSNPENQKTAIAIALQLRSAFGRTWFKISDLKRISKNTSTFEDFELPVLRGYGLVKSKNGKHKVTLAVLEKLKVKEQLKAKVDG